MTTVFVVGEKWVDFRIHLAALRVNSKGTLERKEVEKVEFNNNQGKWRELAPIELNLFQQIVSSNSTLKSMLGEIEMEEPT